eukprot:2590057-Pyramimonas_sp.AAC.2
MGPLHVCGVCRHGRGTACEPCHWGRWWGSPWDHEACEGCAETGGDQHANPAVWAFGGAPYGATNRVRGVPTWAGNRMRALPLGPSVEPPMGPWHV